MSLGYPLQRISVDHFLLIWYLDVNLLIVKPCIRALQEENFFFSPT